MVGGEGVLYGAAFDRVYLADRDGWAVWGIDGATDQPGLVLCEEFWTSRLAAGHAQGRLYAMGEPVPVVCIVDVATGSITANFCMGFYDWNWPVGISGNSSGDRVYLAGDLGTVVVLDARGDTALARIDLGRRLAGLCAVSRADKIYASAVDTGIIFVIDCPTNRVIRVVDVGSPAWQMCYDSATDKVYAARDGSIAVIDAATDSVVATLPVGSHPEALRPAPEFGKLYCTCRDDSSVYVIDTQRDSVASVIRLLGEPYGLCYAGAGGKLYCACRESDTAYVIDCLTDRIVKRVPRMAWGRSEPFVYHDRTNAVYATYRDSLNVLDCLTDSVTRRFALGGGHLIQPVCFEGLDIICAADDRQHVTVIHDDRVPREPAVDAATASAQATMASTQFRLVGRETAELFDITGRRAAELLPGVNNVRGVPAGVYFLRRSSGNKTTKVIIQH